MNIHASTPCTDDQVSKAGDVSKADTDTKDDADTKIDDLEVNLHPDSGKDSIEEPKEDDGIDAVITTKKSQMTKYFDG